MKVISTERLTVRLCTCPPPLQYGISGGKWGFDNRAKSPLLGHSQLCRVCHSVARYVVSWTVTLNLAPIITPLTRNRLLTVSFTSSVFLIVSHEITSKFSVPRHKNVRRNMKCPQKYEM